MNLSSSGRQQTHFGETGSEMGSFLKNFERKQVQVGYDALANGGGQSGVSLVLSYKLGAFSAALLS